MTRVKGKKEIEKRHENIIFFVGAIITTNVLINIKAWLHTRNGKSHLDEKMWKFGEANNISLLSS